MGPSAILGIFIGICTFELVLQIWMTVLNMKNVVKHKDNIPEYLKAYNISDEVYSKAAVYTLSKNRFSITAAISSYASVMIIVASGLAGSLERQLSSVISNDILLSIVYIYIIAAIFKSFSLPFVVYSHFFLEKKYGFNRLSIKRFFKDLAIKIFLFSIVFLPLISLSVLFIEKLGSNWWLYAFGMFAAFKLFLYFFYPVFVAPMFNKFYPLPEGELKDTLTDLSLRLNFKTKGIYLMDGSSRSGHSNAYFTGLGKFRRVVFYDNLVEKLSPDEIAAIFAHEIGHAKNNDVLTSIVVDIFLSFVALFSASLLLKSELIFHSFGFDMGTAHAMIILVIFMMDPMLSLISPIFTNCARRQEYEADRFAIMTLGNNEDLALALMSISKENLCNFVPHKFYSYYNYSHPTLSERIKAIWSITVDNEV